MVSQGFSERLHFRKGCFAFVIVTAAFDNTGIFRTEEPNNPFVLRFVRAAIK